MRNAATEKLLGTASSIGMQITEDAFAEYMDSADPLHQHRASYHFPKTREGTPFSYLVGHSLGLQHVGVEAALNGYLKKWREQAVEGHFTQPNPWFEIENTLRKEMSSLVGATESEVVIMNGLTVNIHIMLSAFYRPKGAKRKIAMENHGFPSDTQCLISQLEVHGFDAEEDLIVISAAPGEDYHSPAAVIPTANILSTIEKRGDEIAVLVLPAIQFLTGQFFDIATIVKAAHAKNIIVGVDCAHAVGNVPLQLHDWDVDFACWCTYKYLNSGPGNIGAAFVHSRHTTPGSTLKHLKGWWGRDRKSRFTMRHEFDGAGGAAAFQISNVNVIGVVALGPSLKHLAAVGMPALREKSLHLTAYLELLLNELVPPGAIEIVTPADPAQRGAQLSVRILPNKLRSAASTEAGEGDSDAEIVQRELLDVGVMVDDRKPDIIRLGPAPIYNSYMDVLNVVRAFSALF